MDALTKNRADPITTEIVRNGVIAVTGEMKTNLMRTAYNTIIYEALDFTTGLFTADGRTVSIGLGLPTFIRGMSETIKAKRKHLGDDIHPGDILITNDSYITGSHLNHVTLSLPIFADGKLSGFACCMAHWEDIGGVLGGVTTDIFSEGLQLPIMKLHRAGKPNTDLIDIIRMNCRIEEKAMGDLRAQVTAVRTGEKRFGELLARYGRDEVLGAIDDIMDHSEAGARARTAAIPDGTYEAESFMDDDAVQIGKRVPVKVKVTVKGEEMTIDLSEMSPQVRGFYNSAQTTGFGCTQVAYKCLTSPTDYPINDGAFRSLKAVVPPGRVISATRPAPMRWWMTYPMTIIDTVFKAMAPVMPDKVAAGHHADLISCNINGINPKTGRLFLGGLGPLGGGWGAKKTEDGVSATVCLNDGDTHNAPVEQVETKTPLMIERHALIENSGGPGRRRGGLGIVKAVAARSPINVNTQIERMHCRPWGLEGGLSGTGNYVHLRRKGETKTDFPNAKVFVTRLEAGDCVTIHSGGGGGFGAPWEREVEMVVEDMRQGYIDAEAAEKYYGVKVDPATFKVDGPATKSLRAKLATEGIADN
jgi:N-methylhydantoinase B